MPKIIAGNVILSCGPHMLIGNSPIRRKIKNINLHHIPDSREYDKSGNRIRLDWY